jgi:pimeloyl-ACP methyl ester carboxylesterase
MFKAIMSILGAVTVSIIIAGCGATGSYTSNEKFSDAIEGPIEKMENNYQGIYRNPIIIVHGFLGANLINKKTGQNVWGKFRGINGFTVSDERMRGLAVPMAIGKPLKDLNDNTVPDGMLETVTIKIMGINFRENAYLNLIDVLKSGGFQPEGFPLAPGRTYNTLFMFAYDWRRDLQWNAAKLHKFVLEKRKYMQEQYRLCYGIKDYDVQFDLIGHSMGGLVSRYYLRFGTADLPPEGKKAKITWAGSNYVDRVIILGTPNAGYLDTILEMQRGIPTPPLPPAVLGTWPTYYQMMPVAARRPVVYADDRKKAVDYFDVNVWKKFRWGLADPKQDNNLQILLPDVKDKNERRRIALDHLDKCLKRAKKFIEVMAVKAKPPKDVRLYLVLGNAVKTTRRATVNPKTGELKVVEYAPGDGKVTESSALFDERAEKQWMPYFSSPIDWRSMIQLRAAHMGITTAPPFKDNVLFLLNALPTQRQLEQMNAKK